MLMKIVGRCLTGAIVLVWSSAVDAACYDTGQQLPSEAVSGFLSNPGQLLTQYPSGGAQLISRIRDLTASDPAALPAIMGLLSTANGEQQSAIGSGLGQAYRICVRPDQAFATQIQTQIAGSVSSGAKDAYAAVNPDVPIGAAGGAGGGGGGGTGVGGPTTGTASSSAGPFSAGLAASSAPNAGTTSLTGAGRGSASGLTSANTSVSP